MGRCDPCILGHHGLCTTLHCGCPTMTGQLHEARPVGPSGPGSSGPLLQPHPTGPLEIQAAVLQRLRDLEEWLLDAEHHAGCSGEYKAADGSWAYRCKCGLRELRDERQ